MILELWIHLFVVLALSPLKKLVAESVFLCSWYFTILYAFTLEIHRSVIITLPLGFELILVHYYGLVLDDDS
jgi:hypothetical protein